MPFRFVNFKNWCFLCDGLSFVYSVMILCTIKRKSADVFVGRSYMAGLICWWLNRISGFNYIFDPRSLYLHENVGPRRIPGGGCVERYWKNVEKRIISKASTVICVSKAMGDYYSGIMPGIERNFRYIPCFADPSPTIDHDRSNLRRLLGYSDSDIVIIYYGSLNTGWNNFDIYKKFFEEISTLGYKVLVISQDCAKLRQTEIVRIKHLSLFNMNEILIRLNNVSPFYCADYGVVLMKETLDWKTRLSVKFAEYTVHGLPVIVGEFVGEAARLVEKFNLSPSTVVCANVSKICLEPVTHEARMRIQIWAKEYFASHRILEYFDSLDS